MLVTQIKKEVLEKQPLDYNSYPINLFPNPLPTPSSYKKSVWNEMLRWFWRARNLPSSQITSHLNKVPIKIQSLSPLIGSGSNRQHKHWLFLFHRHILLKLQKTKENYILKSTRKEEKRHINLNQQQDWQITPAEREIKRQWTALTDVTQLLGHHPTRQKVMSSIPSRAHA